MKELLKMSEDPKLITDFPLNKNQYKNFHLTMGDTSVLPLYIHLNEKKNKWKLCSLPGWMYEFRSFHRRDNKKSVDLGEEFIHGMDQDQHYPWDGSKKFYEMDFTQKL